LTNASLGTDPTLNFHFANLLGTARVNQLGHFVGPVSDASRRFGGRHLRARILDATLEIGVSLFRIGTGKRWTAVSCVHENPFNSRRGAAATSQPSIGVEARPRYAVSAVHTTHAGSLDVFKCLVFVRAQLRVLHVQFELKVPFAVMEDGSRIPLDPDLLRHVAETGATLFYEHELLPP
jgi:hypothetical protein